MNTVATPNRAPYVPQIRLYQNWLRDQRGLSFEHYNDPVSYTHLTLPTNREV